MIFRKKIITIFWSIRYVYLVFSRHLNSRDFLRLLIIKSGLRKCVRDTVSVKHLWFGVGHFRALFLINFAQTINIDSLIFAKGHSKDPRGHFVNLS